MEENKPTEQPSNLNELVAVVDKMKAENDRLEALLKKREEIVMNETKLNILGGKTQTVETPVKEESNKDYVKRMLSNKP